MPAEIAPGVYALDHRVVEGKNAVVLGARGALAIDCGTEAEEGRASLTLARARRPESLWLAMTHCHVDHAQGSAPFRDAGCEVIAHDSFSENLRRHLKRRAAQAEGEPAAALEQMAARLAWPTIGFSDELRLDLGGKTLRFLHTPGHSADSSCVYLEEDRILFGGDTVVTCIPPAFGDGDSRELECSLRRLRELPAQTLVPGHGPLLRGAAAIGSHLDWLASYLSTTREAVQRACHQDRETWLEAALTAAPAERLYGTRIDMEAHHNRSRHRATITKLVAELTAR